MSQDTNGSRCRCAARGSHFISNTQPICKQLATTSVLVNDEVVIVLGSVAVDAQDKSRDWCPWVEVGLSSKV